jgi:hypothetical protein
MKIMGCDFHPSFQQIAMVDSETGRFCSRRKRCFHQLNAGTSPKATDGLNSRASATRWRGSARPAHVSGA